MILQQLQIPLILLILANATLVQIQLFKVENVFAMLALIYCTQSLLFVFQSVQPMLKIFLENVFAKMGNLLCQPSP